MQNAKNNGSAFELLVHEIYSAIAANEPGTQVEHNVRLDGPDGPRQIDVLIKSRAAGIELITVVECRDFKSLLNVTAIDGFSSKLKDLRASKGILVTRKGFTKTAHQKARRLGIALALASSAPEILRIIAQRTPIIITRVRTGFKGSNFDAHLEKGIQLHPSSLNFVNDLYLPTLYRDEILAGSSELRFESGIFEWRPATLQPPFFIRDSRTGLPIGIRSITFQILIEASHHFGYINDIEEIKALHTLDGSTTKFVAKTEDFPDIAARMPSYSSLTDIPSFEKPVHVVLLDIPVVPETIHMGIESLQSGQRAEVSCKVMAGPGQG